MLRQTMMIIMIIIIIKLTITTRRTTIKIIRVTIIIIKIMITVYCNTINNNNDINNHKLQSEDEGCISTTFLIMFVHGASGLCTKTIN